MRAPINVTMIISIVGLLISLSAVVYAAGVLGARVDDNEKEVDRLRTKSETVATKADLRELRTDLKEDIGEILKLAGFGGR
jgi:hypothetical protein